MRVQEPRTRLQRKGFATPRALRVERDDGQPLRPPPSGQNAAAYQNRNNPRRVRWDNGDDGRERQGQDNP